MPTITVRELVEGYEAMQELAQRKLKINPSFWLARQLRRLAPDYVSFTEKRAELIRQYGAEAPADSGSYTVKPENTRVFSEAIGELLTGSMSADIEPRTMAFLALDEVEPRLLGAMWFLWADETPAK